MEGVVAGGYCCYYFTRTT